MDAIAVIAAIGGIALLIGIFGGGIKAKEVEIPLIPMFVRILSAITGIILLGITIWLSVRSSTPTSPPTSYTATSAISTLSPSFTNSPTKNVSQPTYACTYRGKSDEATIRYILDDESKAAIQEDFNTFELVYLTDATITDADQVWRDPIQYYKDVFAIYAILDIKNTNLRIQLTSDESAIVYMTSSVQIMAQGSSISKYTDDSVKVQFRKDPYGCWRISQFDRILHGYK